VIEMITWDDLVNLFLYGIRTETLRKFLNNQHKSKGDHKMEINQDTLKNNPELEKIVKEVVREELKPEIEKMKQANVHLQEGNMYLNE
jgi:vacuolar-type H+-ATPase catalytic subunit A/Vma1